MVDPRFGVATVGTLRLWCTWGYCHVIQGTITPEWVCEEGGGSVPCDTMLDKCIASTGVDEEFAVDNW